MVYKKFDPVFLLLKEGETTLLERWLLRREEGVWVSHTQVNSRPISSVRFPSLHCTQNASRFVLPLSPPPHHHNRRLGICYVQLKRRDGHTVSGLDGRDFHQLSRVERFCCCCCCCCRAG